MLQTLFFKFSGAQQSIDLFTILAGKNEALLRIGTGILELIAAALLFTPKKTGLGAVLTLGLMGGAMFSHLTILGIVHNNDGGMLFIGSAITFMAGAILLFLYKKELPFIGQKK